MKRFLAILICMFMIFTLCSCKDGGESVNSEPYSSDVVSSEPETVSRTVSETASEPQSSEPEKVYTDGFNVNTGGLAVVLFHHVVPKEIKQSTFPNNEIVETTEDFEAKIKALYDEGIKSVTSEQLYDFIVNGKELPERSVVITFDDGYRSNTGIAAPILRKYGYTAILFTMTKDVTSPYEEYDPYLPVLNYLRQQDIDENKDVFEFACHTDDFHRDLSSASVDDLKADLKKSLAKLPTNMFAYPIGKYSDAIINAVSDCGFTMAFTTNSYRVLKGNGNTMLIPRYTVITPTTPEAFVATVKGFW